jgi:hypothetical protein
VHRFAGRYVGEWHTEALQLAEGSPGAPTVLAFSTQPGQMRGELVLELECDGSLSGRARGQTERPLPFTAAVQDGGRIADVLGALDLVAEVDLGGGLVGRRADVRHSQLDAAMEGRATERPEPAPSPPEEEPTPSAPVPFQRWFVAEPASRWDFSTAQPGALAGSWQGSLDLRVSAAGFQPGLAVRSHGRWAVARVAERLCPWQGTVAVEGAFLNEQRHRETLQLMVWPTPDGRLTGTAAGQAEVSGGPPSGCHYSGGGAFTLRVVGERSQGRFRLRLEDDEQPQLLVVATCPSGRYVAPHRPLAALFPPLEVAETPGAQAAAEATPAPGGGRGSLQLTIQPVAGAAPP